jgi:alpha-ketoglutarate-dependent taurine dioxygenase
MNKITLETNQQLELRPLAGNIGAEIRGIDASAAMDTTTLATVRAALLRHKMIVLRNQALDYPAQVRFARQFGALTLGHPIFDNATDKPMQREFDSRSGTRANHWHTDLTFLDRPPAFCFLHSIIVPPTGGDTIWANTATAYESLPAELRHLADSLRIVHSNDSDYTDDTVDRNKLDYIARIFEAEHPAVHVHPETQERSLLLGGFARRVRGLPPQTSRDIIRLLQEYITRPEQTVRWTWQVGDLVIWDNRSTLHYAVCDYGEARRRNERVTVVGSTLKGVDGRSSHSLSGDASSFQNGAGSFGHPSSDYI